MLYVNCFVLNLLRYPNEMFTKQIQYKKKNRKDENELLDPQRYLSKISDSYRYLNI